jgi:hypothetical protein
VGAASFAKVRFAYLGANPTIVSYNARDVKFYNATSSLARFESIIIFFYFEKPLNPTRYNVGVVVVNSQKSKDWLQVNS